MSMKEVEGLKGDATRREPTSRLRVYFSRFCGDAKAYFTTRPLLFIILGTLLLRLVYLLLDWPLWWDSHVYISMGKYIFSGGEIGIWELYRPLVHPIILGAFWKAGLNIFIVGKLLDIIFSILAIYLVYLLGKKIFTERIALIAVLLFSLNATLITITGLVLADPISLFLGLLGIYCLLEDKWWRIFAGGSLLAFALLARFPMGIWFGAAVLVVFFRKEKIQSKVTKLAFLISGFFLPVIPYLLFNYQQYRDPFLPFLAGSWIVTTATWLYGSGFLYYFRYFFVADPIYLFFFPSFYYFFKEKLWHDYKKALTFLIPLLTLLYFLYVPRKEVRYLLIALPFFALVVSYSLLTTYERLKQLHKPVVWPRAFIVICLLLVLLPIPTTINIERLPEFDEQIKTAITTYNITGTVVSSNPAFVSFLDRKIVTLDGMTFAPEKYESVRGNYGILFLNDCDLPCAPDDQTCQRRKKELFAAIHTENTLILKETYLFNEGKDECMYSMLLPK